jgi:hypothetical protein
VSSEILETAQIPTTSLVNEYFATVHPWLPIINQEHFRSRLSLWPQSGDVGLATLLLAFYVVTRNPCTNGDHSMRSLSYQTVKQIFVLQASAGGTLELLRAGLIIAYYECGHGLPREAYITLATCVAIAQPLGLEFEDMNDQPGLDAERSACRWAILFLDRYATSATPPMLLLREAPEPQHYRASILPSH